MKEDEKDNIEKTNPDKKEQNNFSNNIVHEFSRIEMNKKDFTRLSTYITSNYGIKLPEIKRIMLQSRLQKRLRGLKMNNFTDYCDYVLTKGNEHEIINMIDLVSTNKTDFFREPVHYSFLTDEALPTLISKKKPSVIKIWSAGCSSGEEPYTIAITMNEYLKTIPTIDYSILGTDISTQILNKAINAIYDESKIDVITSELKKKYFLKSKDNTKRKVRVIKELREKIKYQRLNFMDKSYLVKGVYDIIFCRNVLIYFDRENQENVLRNLCGFLKKDGYLFLGHSESILKMNLPLKQVKPSTFIKTTVSTEI